MEKWLHGIVGKNVTHLTLHYTYEGFINYMNIIQDLKQRVDKGRKK